MANVLETTRTTEIPLSNVVSKTNKTGRVRSDASINRFLIKNKGYEFINGKLEKKKMPTPRHSGIATRLTIELGIFLKANKIGRVYSDNTLFQIGENKRIPDVSFVSKEKSRRRANLLRFVIPRRIWRLK